MHKVRQLRISVLAMCLLVGCGTKLRSGNFSMRSAQTGQDSCPVLEIEKPNNSVQMFGYLLFTDRTQPSVWRAYRTESEAQRARNAREISDITSLWIRSDNTLRVTMFDGSDDYAFTFNYCFRPDGMLSTSVTTLGVVTGVHRDPNVNVGPVSRTTQRTFDRCGAQVSERVGPVVEAATNRPAPEGTGMMNREEPKITSIRSLPFFDLVDLKKLPNAALQPPDGCSIGR